MIPWQCLYRYRMYISSSLSIYIYREYLYIKETRTHCWFINYKYYAQSDTYILYILSTIMQYDAFCWKEVDELLIVVRQAKLQAKPCAVFRNYDTPTDKLSVTNWIWYVKTNDYIWNWQWILFVHEYTLVIIFQVIISLNG